MARKAARGARRTTKKTSSSRSNGTHDGAHNGAVNGSHAEPAADKESGRAKGNGHGRSALAEWFGTLAQSTARLAGKPATFIVCVALVLVWAATGPLFGYSDTWQLVINTSTTIITFLMVFLIQNTQNRDTMALQVKLAELIYKMHGAENRLAAAEDLSEEELDMLHKRYCGLAEHTLEHLKSRRAEKTQH